MKKDIVAGLGEIGFPIFKILSKNFPIEGFDKNFKLNVHKKSLENHQVDFLHVCIPFSKNFISDVLKLEKKFTPNAIVIHSTVSPHTTEKLQKKLQIPIIYSATRGVHKRMSRDLKRYVKFYSVYSSTNNSNNISKLFEKRFAKCNIKCKKMSSPLTLELAKIICDKENVDFDEMWSFSDEIHKFLKNRPKMFPGIIGGHCVIPNLELIDNSLLNQIDKINKNFAKRKK